MNENSCCANCQWVQIHDTSTWEDDNDITVRCRLNDIVLYKGSSKYWSRMDLPSERPNDCFLNSIEYDGNENFNRVNN